MLEQTIFNALLLGMTYVVVASGLTLVFGVMHILTSPMENCTCWAVL